MFEVQLYAKVRHAVMIEGLSRREAARRVGIHRNTIPKMLSFSVSPGYRRRTTFAANTVRLQFQAFVDNLANSNAGDVAIKRPRSSSDPIPCRSSS
jgi:hypothetical protein